MVRPGAATSTAASMPSGTFSTAETSSTTGMGRSSRLVTRTASSPARIAATTSTPAATAAFSVAATSSKSHPCGTTQTTGSPGCCSSSSPIDRVVPTPRPSPPGVVGLCPIIVDSVMIVSVIVSMARPLITGVASFSSTVSTSPALRPARARAPRIAFRAPSVFSGVPLTPVVRVRSVPRWVIEPSGATTARDASVVELPMSTPTTSSPSGGPPSRASTSAGGARTEDRLDLHRTPARLDAVELLQVQQGRLGLPAGAGHLVVPGRHRLRGLPLGVLRGVRADHPEHRGVEQRGLREELEVAQPRQVLLVDHRRAAGEHAHRDPRPGHPGRGVRDGRQVRGVEHPHEPGRHALLLDAGHQLAEHLGVRDVDDRLAEVPGEGWGQRDDDLVGPGPAPGGTHLSEADRAFRRRS